MEVDDLLKSPSFHADATDNDGNTTLHHLAKGVKRFLPHLILLLQHRGVNVFAVNVKDQTAYDVYLRACLRDAASTPCAAQATALQYASLRRPFSLMVAHYQKKSDPESSIDFNVLFEALGIALCLTSSRLEVPALFAGVLMDPPTTPVLTVRGTANDELMS
jgi:hypothetical protein